MDKSVNVIFRNSFSNPFNAFHMHILEVEILGGVASAHEIIYHIGVSDALFEGGSISEVILLVAGQRSFRNIIRTSYHEYNSSQISSNLQMALGHLFSERHNDRTSLPCYQIVSPGARKQPI